MRLKVLSSSSKGNCYILQSKTGAVLQLECGVSFLKVQEALNFNIRNICAALVTHCHGDHAKYIKDVARSGIPVYANNQTISKVGMSHHRLQTIEADKIYRVGEFSFTPVKMVHDVDIFAFLIAHKEMGVTAFITDTCYSEYKFGGVNNYMIECNYDSDIIHQPGHMNKFVRDRVFQSHLSLDTCKQLLLSNDLTLVRKIILIHLSDSNSDEIKFKRELEQTTGKQTLVANRGMDIDFDREQF